MRPLRSGKLQRWPHVSPCAHAAALATARRCTPPRRRLRRHSFLQQNALTGLSPALAALPQLDTLNIAGNTLDGLGGLAGCGALRTLVASDNRLGPDVGAVAALAACTQLESLDLQNNKLEEGPALLELLKGLPDLKCLYLRGAPGGCWVLHGGPQLAPSCPVQHAHRGTQDHTCLAAQGALSPPDHVDQPAVTAFRRQPARLLDALLPQDRRRRAARPDLPGRPPRV